MNLPSPSKGRASQILDCARLASLAYEPRTVFPNGHLKPFSVGSDHGFVAWNANAIVIAIAGSDDCGDWFSNLKTRSRSTVQFGTMIGHAGIFTAAATIAKSIKDIIPHEVCDRPMFITGHSRGGAIAHWLPEFIRYPAPISVLSFGAPRCVRGTVRPSLIERWSYVLPCDPVPLMPLWSRGWRDPGVRIFLHEDGADDEWPTEWFWHIVGAVKLGITYALRRPLGRLVACTAVGKAVKERHVMARYIERLDKLTGVAA